MTTQSQRNSDAIIELDKKVAILSHDLELIRDNHLEHLSREVQSLHKSVNQLFRLAVGFAIMLAVIFAETVQSLIGVLL